MRIFFASLLIALSGPSAHCDNINNNAGQGASSQAAGMASNLASSGLLTATAIPMISNPNPGTQTTGYIMLAMAALAAIQGAMLGGNAAQSSATQQASQYTPTGTNYDTGTWSADSSTSAATTDTSTFSVLASKTSEGAKAMSALESGGYSLTESGLKDPSGKTTPLSSFSSPSSLLAAGVSPEGVKKISEVLDQANKKSGNVIAMGIDSNGGGGDRSTAGADDEWQKAMGKWKFKNPFDKSNNEHNKLIAGKSVQLGGERIGVALDNIFQKITRRFDEAKKNKQFFD